MAQFGQFAIALFIIDFAIAQNALVIVADDGGFESTVYGNKVVDTPGMQMLADRGLVFDNAFTVVSSCSSSRASLLTGLPPHQNGMYGLHQDEHHFQVLDHIVSVSSILKNHGIATGKLHVGPDATFPFDFKETEENHSIMQVGRNITYMLELYRKFLDENGNRTFLLYIGFHDTHRCHPSRGFGPFCERFGNGQPGMGLIPDWIPKIYKPEDVIVPYFVPETLEARADIAAQYTAVTRMDRGIQLFLEELIRRKLIDTTLVIYVSDNGIPFPSGRTNLYDPGMREPLIVSDPLASKSFGRRTSVLARSNTDSFSPPRRSVIFGSQSLHEISMYYPMRVARTHRYKLIHNLNNRAPFPIDQDFYVSPTFQGLLNRTRDPSWHGWYKEIGDYYFRPEFELYDIIKDPRELKNLAVDQKFSPVFKKLKTKLHRWMKETQDPWLCAPHAVKEGKKKSPLPGCYPLYNEY